MKNEFSESGPPDLLAGIKPEQSGLNSSPCCGTAGSGWAGLAGLAGIRLGLLLLTPFFLTLVCSVFLMNPVDHRGWNSLWSYRQASVIDY